MDVVDEREGAHLLELVAQREDQQQRELREVRHRAAHVAEHHELVAVRPLGPVVGHQRYAAGGDRGADGTPEVQRAAPLGVVLLGEPGRESPGQRVDLATHLLEVGLARGGEVDPVDARPDRDVGDVLGPLLLGDPPPGVVLDLAGEAADPATRDPGRLLLGAALGQQRLHDPLHQVRGRHPLQRGVRRPARQPRPATGHRAEPTDHLDREPGQRLLVAVHQRLGELLAERRQRLGVVADRRLRRVVGRVVMHAFPDQPREVDVEERVEGRPLALLLDQRGGVRVADRRPPVPRQRGQRGDRVDVLGQRDGQAGAAQRLEEGDVPLDQPAAHDRATSGAAARGSRARGRRRA